MVRSSTDQLHNLAVQGPNSREIMKRMIWTAPHQPTIDELGWFRFAVGRLGGPTGRRWWCRGRAIPASWALRSSATRRTATAVYDAVWDGMAQTWACADGPCRAGHGADRGGADLCRL
jgi:aminomethyltransferase